MQSSEEGAQTSIYLAVSEEVEGKSGLYFVDCKVAEDSVNPLANDAELAKKLWDYSMQVTGLAGAV